MEPLYFDKSDSTFETPHLSSAGKKKYVFIVLIILAAVAYNVWYYFKVYTKVPDDVVPEVIVPPSDVEKNIITSDLEARVAKIDNQDKAQMMQNLSARSGLDVKPQEREVSIKGFQN